MAILTIRLPDDKHERLKFLAKYRNISLNKLFEEFSTTAICEFDAETRFKALAASGSPESGLAFLDRLDAHFEGAGESGQ
jgi:hypothetical protein